jgi:hypothetical protein
MARETKSAKICESTREFLDNIWCSRTLTVWFILLFIMQIVWTAVFWKYRFSNPDSPIGTDQVEPPHCYALAENNTPVYSSTPGAEDITT